MVADTKMEDTTLTSTKKKDGGDEKTTTTTTTTTTNIIPPLEAAAKRLDRLLGGGLSDKDKQLYTYTNPAKVVRRWLGTASGASGNASSKDIALAAKTLLDPSGVCQAGRALLLTSTAASGTVVVEHHDASATAVATADTSPSGMDIDSEDTATKNDVTTIATTLSTTSTTTSTFLSMASCREVESWLVSLQVRILWKENKCEEAMDMAQQGITFLLGHLEVASKKMTSSTGVSVSSLFPLLARLYRFRSLGADGIVGKDPSLTTHLRQELSRAHNMGCLRRDVDSQATLLNLMLRDLLSHSQSEWLRNSPE
jgi:hypothetical protein